MVTLELIKLDKHISVSGLYSFFYFENTKNFHSKSEKHNLWELVYVDSGNILSCADGVNYVIPQGSVIFHKPMELHSLESIDNTPHNILVLTFETDSKDMSFFENKILSLNLKQKKLLGKIIEELSLIFGPDLSTKAHHPEDYSKGQYAALQIGINYLETFLLDFIRNSYAENTKNNISYLEQKNTNDTIIDDIIAFLSENIYDNITLDDVCNHFYLGKSYICELFKLHTGKSIIDYYIDIKIAKAKLLMREGEMNFTQISEKLGYSSIHSFSRLFKQRVKVSPSAYLKSIR